MRNFIVIGAGSGGCAVAARLSESGAPDVLLLAAGGPDTGGAIHVPASFPSLFKGDAEWNCETTLQRHVHDRQEHLPRGKILGGSSSQYALNLPARPPVELRRVGCTGKRRLSCTDVLPYFTPKLSRMY